MKIIQIFLLFSFTLLAFSCFAQEKPAVAVAPLASIGNISNAQKQIVFNRFLDELSRRFSLISQTQFNDAQEKAYEELDTEQCNEEQCVRKIQEILQVENLFVLQMVKENSDTQLSLTLIDLEDKTVRSDYCQGCNTFALNQRISGLVQKVIGEKPLPVPVVNSSGIKGKGRVFISSVPSEADIYLDGQPLGQKSDALLKDIPVGKHTFRLIKGNLSQSKTIEVSPNKLVSVELKLELGKGTLLVSSNPFKANVYLDGKQVGKTPVEIETKLGKHQVEIKMKGYLSISKEVIVEPGKVNQLEFQLQDVKQFKGFLSATSTPPDAIIQFEGGTYVKSFLKPHSLPLSNLKLPIGQYTAEITKKGYETIEQSFTITDEKTTTLHFQLKALPAKLEVNVSRNEAIKKGDGKFQIFIGGKLMAEGNEIPQMFQLELPAGKHTIEVKHSSGKYISHSKEINVQRGQTYKENLFFQLNDAYKGLYQDYLTDHESWKWKTGGVFGGAIVSLLYVQMANANIDDINEERTDLKKQASGYMTEDAYQSIAEEDQKLLDEGKTHQQNQQIGVMFFLGFTGYGSWLLMNEPSEPKFTSLRLHVNPQGLLSLNYRYKW